MRWFDVKESSGIAVVLNNAITFAQFNYVYVCKYVRAETKKSIARPCKMESNTHSQLIEKEHMKNESETN